MKFKSLAPLAWYVVPAAISLTSFASMLLGPDQPPHDEPPAAPGISFREAERETKAEDVSLSSVGILPAGHVP